MLMNMRDHPTLHLPIDQNSSKLTVLSLLFHIAQSSKVFNMYSCIVICIKFVFSLRLNEHTNRTELCMTP